MNMDARTQRTLLRLLSIFLAAGAGDAIIQFANGATSYDWRHLAGALVAAAIVAAEQFLKNTGDSAPPTVAAVNEALRPPAPVNLVAGLTATPVTFTGTSLPVRFVRPPSELVPSLPNPNVDLRTGKPLPATTLPNPSEGLKTGRPLPPH